MKDLNNMFEVYIKGEYSDETERMSRLTRGLMYVYDMPYKAKDIHFGQLDSHRTGLTSEELEMCLRWREAYFEFHRYSGESSNVYSYTEEDILQQEREQTEARNTMLEIEKELGEPQGRFTI